MPANFRPNYVKRPVRVRVTFALTDGVTRTLEGPVNHRLHDAIVTGSASETWPIKRADFEKTYEPCEAVSMGEAGWYQKRPLPVHAQQLQSATVVALSDNRGELIGQPGDWMITTPSGQRWVVADEIFQVTYAPAETE